MENVNCCWLYSVTVHPYLLVEVEVHQNEPGKISRDEDDENEDEGFHQLKVPGGECFGLLSSPLLNIFAALADFREDLSVGEDDYWSGNRDYQYCFPPLDRAVTWKRGRKVVRFDYIPNISVFLFRGKSRSYFSNNSLFSAFLSKIKSLQKMRWAIFCGKYRIF